MRKSTAHAAFLAAGVVGLGLGGGVVRGDAILPSPSLPPMPAVYRVLPVNTQIAYPLYNVVLTQVQHNVPVQTPVIVSAGGNDTETFTSDLTGLVSAGGGPDVPFTLTGPVQVEEFGHTGMTTGTWDTQMLSMDMTGIVGGANVEVTLDASNPTLGQTSVTDIGGGLYDISSFFDVFTDLSINGGTPDPASTPPDHVVLGVPEPTSLSVLGVGAVALCMRRRKSA